MTLTDCRLCGRELRQEPILRLSGMPKAAQYYPAENEFLRDQGIVLSIYQCTDCGLVQLNQAPVDYYREVITAATLSPKSRQARLVQMQKLVQQYGLRGKKVVEVGCGKGEMLDILAEAGLEPTGLEASAVSAKIGQAAGRNVIQGYIGDRIPLAGGPFDTFISLNYLEHLPQPGWIIKLIADQTVPGAIGYVTVPNLDYLLRTKCFYEFVADHLSYFTASTLAFAFAANGFDVLDCRTINEDNDLAAAVRKRAPLDLAGEYQDVEKLIKELRELVDNYRARGKKAAVWGAGHRTLALLALGDLKELKYVIDSAKFKQGKFTPVLHLPIVPPEQLRTQPVDLVIVMVPGLYPGEVLKTLQEMAVTSEVAALRGNKIEFIHT